MRVIISYGARRRWRRGAMHTYTTHNAHTLDSHICSHPHTRTSMHACMHACMLSRPPSRSYATLYTHPPPAPHPTIHIAPTYTICCTTAHPRTLQHTQHPTHCNTTHATTYRLRVPPRDHDETGDKRQHRHTHHADRDHDDEMTMCDDM